MTYTIEFYKNVRDIGLLEPYLKLYNITDIDKSAVGGWCFVSEEVNYILPADLIFKIVKNDD